MNALPYKPVSEEEIIDVLLGDADPALEARVRQAVRHDPNAAALYAQWSRVLPTLQRQALPLRRMNERVRDRVMKRLAEEALAGAPERVADVIFEPPRRPVWPLWLRSRTAALTAAALALVLLGGPAAWRWFNPMLTAVTVSGGPVTVQGPDGRPLALQPGTQVRLPARLAAAPGASAELRLADGSRLSVGGGAELVVQGRRAVVQTAGSSSFDIVHRWLWGRFTVQLPAGMIEDLGTAFGVTVAGARGAVVRVTEGRVRVNPRQGAGVEARAGERALLDETSATVEPIPFCTDLARARALFPTRLLRHGPAPSTPSISSTSSMPSIPSGAQELIYHSGPLSLKAWVSAEAGDFSSGVPALAGIPAKAGTPKLPVVVFLHDAHALTPADWAAAEPYRRAGFIVVMPMLRGENGNPGDHELLWGEVDDAVAAGRAAAVLPHADPARIYLAGAGVGGTLALLAAMVPSPYAAAFALDPLADPAPLFADPPFDPADPRERLLRTPAAFPDSLRIPLRLACAAGPRLESARTLARAAALLGKDCQFQSAALPAGIEFFTAP